MSMGKREQRKRQQDLWIAQQELASAPRHPFYQCLNELLESASVITSKAVLPQFW